MSQFPVLKTGAVTQYPSRQQRLYSTDVLTFVDGRSQRARRFQQPLHRWTIQLNLVDEGELAAIDAFFSGEDGALGSFSFTDPWDGTVYPDCGIESDELQIRLDGPERGKTQITIRENRT